MSAPDLDQQPSYDAEKAAFDGTPVGDHQRLPSLLSDTEEVLASAWWQSIYRRPVTVESAQVNLVKWGGYAVPTQSLVRLSVGGSRRFIIPHELAHLVDYTYSSTGHGPSWRAIYVHLTAGIYGAEYGALLAETFERHGLVVPHTSLPDIPSRPIIDIDAMSIATAPTGGWRKP